MPPAIWHGSTAEARALELAFAQNCTCDYEAGVRKSCCPPHAALLHDQRMLNGLLWMRREATRLRRGEGLTT